ncbi:MAG: VCBS repeat-containing protein, partial [Bacteroidota bacterium]|nr:VCBS repeat-containing protein [Bacteroidota bacterium]
MKQNFTLLICFLLISSFAISQQSFIPHNVTRGSSPGKITLTDIDNDSDLDLLAFYHNDHLLAWYRNDGNGYFDSLIVISDKDENFNGGYVADIDDDGNIDVITGGYNHLSWYKNLGNGNFEPPQTISNNVDFVSSVFAIDLDNDSLIDVISASWFDNKIAWYKNFGNGNFGTQQIISTNALSASGIWATDLDNDSLVDVISSSYSDNKIAWYKNLGGGTFGSEQIITNTAQGAFTVMAANIDNDSLPDVISCHAYGNGNDKITWHKNLGGGSFSPENIINNSLVIPRYFFPADFDNDNDLDMVMTSWYQDSLVWQENLGNGIFGPQQLISNTIDGPCGVYAGDLDGDGFMDIVAGADKASSIEVYINRGTGSFDLNQTIANAAVDVKDVFATDLDNDGKTDILSASKGDSKVAWYKNLGNKEFSLQKVISDSSFEANSVYAADFDNDGFTDVVSGAWSDSIAWHKNMQNGNFDIPQNIPGAFGNTNLLMAKDIDGDGLTDIIGNIGSGASGDAVHWAKNLGNSNFGALQFISSLTGLNTFDIADLNNDGYPDIVFGSGYIISIVVNDGTGNFLPVQYVNQSIGAIDLHLTDLNGDGFIDILYSVREILTSNDFIGWYQNDGLGNFTTPTFISYIENLSYTIVATDIDNDGDKDIFTAPNISSYNSGNLGRLVWFENLGSGNFGQLQNVDYTGGKILDIHISDIDNDNDNDIVLALPLYSTVKWLENTLNNLIDTIVICAEDSAIVFGNWVNLPGYYYDTLQNSLGGDSINIISLEHYQTYFPVDTVEICEGEPYDFYGQLLDTSGVYFASFHSVQGCDSIEELPLVVIPAPAVSISSFTPDSVSIDTPFIALPIATPTGGIYSGYGVTGNTFYPSIAGL